MKPLPERLRDHASLPPALALAKWDEVCADMKRAAERIETVEEAGRCRTCGSNPSRLNGECRPCAMYRKRNGHSRPEHLTKRQPELNWKRGKSA